MKLLGMAKGFNELLQQPSSQVLSLDQRFGMLVDDQWTWKENRRLKQLLEEVKLKIQASFEALTTPKRMPSGFDFR